GQSPSSYRLTCPAGLALFAGLCFETSERTGASLTGALVNCAAAGRRLPSDAELAGYEKHLSLALPKEWVSGQYLADVSGVSDFRGMLWEFDTGAENAAGVTSGTSSPYRCLTNPSN